MIYVRCEASKSAGFGHLSRCLIMARALQEQGAQVAFIVPDRDTNQKKLIENAKLEVIRIPYASAYADEIISYPKNYKNIIIDLGTRENLDNTEKLTQYLNVLKAENYNIALLNGLAGDSYNDQNSPEILAYIQPYWGAENEPKPNAKHWIKGKDYVLIDKIYNTAFKCRKGVSVNKILVTFGGADPQKNTIKVLNAAPHLNKDIKLRAIIGPFFSKEHAQAIDYLQSKTLEQIECITAPKLMLAHYQWADLCICGSGMTRYEAAACGLPSLSTAIYPQHEELAAQFASYGTSHYMGLCHDITTKDWASAINALQDTPDTYIKMIKALEHMKAIKPGSQALAKRLIEIFKT